ncbi:sigma-70 family RNA polymerase sigma factor [Streptomycetaceae bacterium NBC_01309]
MFTSLRCARDQIGVEQEPAVGPRPVDDLPAPGEYDADPGADLAERIYQRHAAALLAFCTKLTSGDRQWAEDVVQETMLRAWRHAELLGDQCETLMPWLITVARRIVIDDIRARKTRPPECAPGPLDYLAADDPCEALLTRLALGEALPTLAWHHREILFEVVVRDRDLKETAAALGIPVGTAKSRRFYAVRALREALAAHDCVA